MKYYGTKNGKDYGFYLAAFEGAVEVADEAWEDLMDQCSHGKILQPNENGYPTAVEYTQSVEEVAQEVRLKRNLLLAESDWTQLQDTQLPEDKKNAWTKYRQELRDLPQTQDIGQSVVWPDKPE